MLCAEHGQAAEAHLNQSITAATAAVAAVAAAAVAAATVAEFSLGSPLGYGLSSSSRPDDDDNM